MIGGLQSYKNEPKVKSLISVEAIDVEDKNIKKIAGVKDVGVEVVNFSCVGFCRGRVYV